MSIEKCTGWVSCRYDGNCKDCPLNQNTPAVPIGTPSQQYELYVRDQRIEILEQQNAILQKALELPCEYLLANKGCPASCNVDAFKDCFVSNETKKKGKLCWALEFTNRAKEALSDGK